MLDVLQAAEQQLRTQGIAQSRLEAQILLADILQIARHQLIINDSISLTGEQVKLFKQSIERRLKFEPISRIIGKREFWSMDFCLSTATLDPRPDSETIVAAILNSITDLDYPYEILDLGTGSGCLLLSLLSELPKAKGWGIDLSQAAINTAQSNAINLGLTKRCHFLCQDWNDRLIAKLPHQFDWVVSNPPYIETNKIAALEPEVKIYDPYIALDGGEDGLQCYQALAPMIPKILNSNGRLAIEIGENQDSAIEDILGVYGLKLQKWHNDLNDKRRCGIFYLRGLR